jgi:hypothetical protein
MTETQSKEDVMMNEQVEVSELMDNPGARRLWLIYRALQSLPFDRAIELARTAEAFVIGSLVENQGDDPRIDIEASAAQRLEAAEQTVNEISSSVRSDEEPIAAKRTRLALPPELRDRLLERLDEGAKNAELAAEFGLGPKQVQGIRMGRAREIARRREQLSKKSAHPDQSPGHTASMDEIVRYLRQQDDVVVPHGNGEFLVNGRFHMSLADLVARANRMRARQRKAAFELTGNKPAQPEKISSNGHPLFREKPAASEAHGPKIELRSDQPEGA